MKKLLLLALLAGTIVACNGNDKDSKPGQPTITGSLRNNCPETTVTLTAVAKDAETYQWQKDGIAIAGATSNTLTVSTTAQYSVYAINSHGEGDPQAKYVTIYSCLNPQDTIQFSFDNVYWNVFGFAHRKAVGETNEGYINFETLSYSTSTAGKEWQLDARGDVFAPFILRYGTLLDEYQNPKADTFYFEGGDIGTIELEDAPGVEFRVVQQLMAYEYEDKQHTVLVTMEDTEDVEAKGIHIISTSPDGYEWYFEDGEKEGRKYSIAPVVLAYLTTDHPDITKDGWRFVTFIGEWKATKISEDAVSPKPTTKKIASSGTSKQAKYRNAKIVMTNAATQETIKPMPEDFKIKKFHPLRK